MRMSMSMRLLFLVNILFRSAAAATGDCIAPSIIVSSQMM